MIDRFTDYKDVIDCGPDGVSVAKVIFKEKFGPWKKGYKADSLSLDGDTLTEWSNEGEIIKSCKVKLVPFDDSE